VKVVTAAKTDGLENKTPQTRLSRGAYVDQPSPKCCSITGYFFFTAVRNGSNGLRSSLLASGNELRLGIHAVAAMCILPLCPLRRHLGIPDAALVSL
jgi:hypothetical protein